MDINTAQELALTEMEKYHLKNWYFEFSNTQNRGDCNYKKKRIRLSKPFVSANSEQRVMQTILHEIAHALTHLRYGRVKSHGKEWQATAKELGHTGQAYMSAEPYTTGRSRKRETRKIGTCPNCNRQTTRLRTRDMACYACCNKYSNGKYDVKFKLVWSNSYE